MVPTTEDKALANLDASTRTKQTECVSTRISLVVKTIHQSFDRAATRRHTDKQKSGPFPEP